METSKHKNRQVQIVNVSEVKQTFELSPFNESKYNKWKQDHYHKDENGYFNDLVVGFRNYHTEEELFADYNKQKSWCEDPNDKEVYKNFTFGFKADLYF